MSIQPFTSESYCEGDRTEAWQDVLSGFGLRSSPMSALHGEHATALSRASQDGVGFMRFAAAPSGFLGTAPTGRPANHPDASRRWRRAQGGRIAVYHFGRPPRHASRQSGWQVTLQRDMRAIVLSVSAESFGGRKISLPECRDASIVSPGGLSEVLCRDTRGDLPSSRDAVVGSLEHGQTQPRRDAADAGASERAERRRYARQ